MQGMGTRSLGWGIRGYSRVQKLARILDMTTATAERRLQALQHWEKYGIQAAQDAFGVSRATLYRWRKQFREAGSIVALNPRSRAPRRKRLRWNWPRPVRERILRLRCRHANLGKDKVHKFLRPWCEARGYPVPSASTIGRLIADHPSRMRVTSPANLDRRGRPKPRRRKRRDLKPKGFRAAHCGQMVGVDTIELFSQGRRRYVLTLVDLYSRFGFALGTHSHTSTTAALFLEHVLLVFRGLWRRC